MAAKTTKRAQNRAEMEAAIRRLGREHLSSHGAAGLSLRAIARDLGVVSSAVYRYVPSRDDLLTLLLVEGYDDLADTVEAALGDADDPTKRILTIGTAMRRWAVADPPRWALLYGSPVPGYRAPAERTTGPGTRVIALLLHEFAATEAPGLLSTAGVVVPSGLPVEFDSVRDEFNLAISDQALTLAITVWSTMIGGISLEVFGQFGTDTFGDPESLLQAQIRHCLTASGAG